MVENIIAVVERDKTYTQKHTELILQSINWKQNQFHTEQLLVGKERAAAEEWLLQEFTPPKQPPCAPNTLVCDFICEARKNAENLMTDVFICYDAEEKKERDQIIQALARQCITTWRHDQDITKGADYGKAIELGIEQADNFLFFLSEKSVKSTYCLRELEYAVQLNKRIVPLRMTEVPEADISESLRGLQYIDFVDNREHTDFSKDIDDILAVLRHEQSYFEEHKVLLARALTWVREEKRPSFLLRGFNLENAQTWLRLHEKREAHPPTALHREFIAASVAARGQLGTDVFISYSRKDGDFARKVNRSLQEAGKNTWFDQESISKGVDFEKELYKGIDGADNFLFIISPDSIESEF